MATRTTHPQSITLLNRLLALISPDGTKVSNPYQWMTKTEVIERIAQFSGQDMIAKAVSCTHVREQTAAKTHCGRCSQCLDRRFAILAAGLEAHDPEDFYSTDVLLGIRADDQYKTLAVEWTRHAIDLREIDDKAFLGKFGTETSRVLQGHTPSPKEEIFGLMIGMHRRHGVAVHKVMMQAVALQQAALVDHQLQPSCLLRLWISDPGSNVADLPSIQHPQAVVATEAIGETEVILDPAGPWTARFSLIGSKPVVVVDGLARVSGAPAQVAHQLKEFWFDDVANGRTPKDHHFVLLYTLPKAAPTKETAKQSVRRCRKALSDAYELVFGYKPAQPLLIESGGKLGYRIDPLTKVIDFTNPR